MERERAFLFACPHILVFPATLLAAKINESSTFGEDRDQDDDVTFDFDDDNDEED